MRQGQITISWVLGIAASIAIAAAATMTSSSVRTDNKIGEVKIVQSQTTERVAKLEEAISTLKMDNQEIKMDIKQILKLLK